MTCQESVECVKQILPTLLAILALVAVIIISMGMLPQYEQYINELLGFAFINLGISR